MGAEDVNPISVNESSQVFKGFSMIEKKRQPYEGKGHPSYFQVIIKDLVEGNAS